MRTKHGFGVLAAVASAAAIAAPAANAKFDNTTFPPLGPPRAVQQHSGGSDDWVLIALGGAGVVALAGTGVLSSRRGRLSTRSRAGAISG
jgi:hypothetical protein